MTRAMRRIRRGREGSRFRVMGSGIEKLAEAGDGRIHVGDGIEAALEVAFFGIHVFAEILEVVEGIDLGGAFGGFVYEKDLVASQSLHVDKVGVVGGEEELRGIGGMDEVEDEIGQTGVESRVKLVHDDTLAVVDDIEEEEESVEKFARAGGFFKIEVEKNVMAVAVKGFEAEEVYVLHLHLVAYHRKGGEHGLFAAHFDVGDVGVADFKGFQDERFVFVEEVDGYLFPVGPDDVRLCLEVVEEVAVQLLRDFAVHGACTTEEEGFASGVGDDIGGFDNDGGAERVVVVAVACENFCAPPHGIVVEAFGEDALAGERESVFVFDVVAHEVDKEAGGPLLPSVELKRLEVECGALVVGVGIENGAEAEDKGLDDV